MTANILEAGKPATQCEASGGEFGTMIAFADSPDEALKQARESGKLAFVMHVSGNFKKPGFT